MDLTPRTFDAGAAVQDWLAVVGILAGVVLALSFLLTLLSRGPSGAAGYGRNLWAGLKDLVLVSPAKVWALAQLTYREALRRRALYVFGLFAVLFMFAGWFLTNAGNRPADQVKVYVSFVLTVIGWLTLLVMLLLSCWGLPEDIRRRSLHTVVTKPARRSEVVLGRMLGYGLIGTVILAVMGGVGYFWIVRQGEDVSEALVARRPVFGEVQFYGRDGAPAEKGLNVGNIWEYRSYIDGASRMFAAYTFDGVTDDVLRDVRIADPDTGEVTDGKVLQLESDFEGFRTVKGDMTRGLAIQYTYVNPETGLVAPDPDRILLQEFDGNVHNRTIEFASRDPETGELRQYDLLRDFVTDGGSLTIEVRSLDPQQLLGMGKADLFVRPPDGPFWASYAGSVAAVWLKMILLVALGVTASTFVKGPVATLLVFTLLIVGQRAKSLIDSLVTGAFEPRGAGASEGGGPVESAYRILTHANTVRELAPGAGTDAIKGVDRGLLYVLNAFGQVIPDFSAFDTAARTASGFAVPVAGHLLPAAAVTLAFLLPCYVIGTLSLRSRELESK